PWTVQTSGTVAVDLRSSGRPGLGLGLSGGMVWGSLVPYFTTGEWEQKRGLEHVCWLMKSLFAGLSNQMAEQRAQHEQERTWLQQQHNSEKDNLVQEQQREASSLERQARATLQQHQQHAQEWRKHDSQTISDLEAQVSSLHEELQQVHALHKQKLAEMALLQEEERQKASLNKEASMQQLRSDMERIANDLKRSHQQEMDATLHKVNMGNNVQYLIRI
ncbi:hypothetical protein XENORESO_004939, partial [Xenotaenia resolanae]